MENRNIKLTDLSSEEQESIGRRFVLPEDITEIYINHNGQPYKLLGSSRMVLRVNKGGLIDGGFHRK